MYMLSCEIYIFGEVEQDNIQDNKRIIELKKLMQEFHLTDEQLKHIGRYL